MQPLPSSRKNIVEGSRPDIRVPMREIAQTDTPASFGVEKNPPVYVYDTSGPYSDPAAQIDIRSGLAPIRARWIEERADTEPLSGPTSAYGRERLADAKLAELRFDLKRTPLRAKPGANVSQMHCARRGIITPEMEYIAIRENLCREAYVQSLKDTGPTGRKMAEAVDAPASRRMASGAAIPQTITAEFVRDEVARGRAIIPRTSITRKASR